MKIYVCVKHVPDSAATITIRDGNRIDEDITFLLNPYDEHAVTEAARIKAGEPDAEVVAVCVGKPAAEGTVRSALAMGADRGILITTEARQDSIVTARALKTAIERDGTPDVIFTGRESIDAEGMQTMFRLAHSLGMPAATNVVSLTLEADRVVVESERAAGARDVLALRRPCVVAAGKGLNKPRYPTLPDIVQARKKEVRQIPLGELGIQTPEAAMTLTALRPALEARNPTELTGTPEEAARKLARILLDTAGI